MDVYLFGFQKRKNSTIRPALSAGTEFSVDLKDNTSVLNPVLIFNATTAGMPRPFTPAYFTYAFIPNFERYYFVTDWQYIKGVWECYLSVDVLASFKTSIGTMACYIERSASTSNGDIIDNLYPAKTDVKITSATIATSWNGIAPSGGSYILGLVNYQGSNHVGAVSYYAMNNSQLNQLMAFLFGNNIYNAGSITEVGEDLFKSLFNPFQYVVSCIWFPGSPSNFGDTTTSVKVGYWDTGVTAYNCKALAEVKFVTGTIPAHPQASMRGNFLNYAPYTRITLFCPPFGEIPLDPTFTRNGKYLYCKTITDPITGQATIRCAFANQQSGGWNGKPCVEKSAMFGVPIQLAQVLSDYSGAINTFMNGLTSGSIVGAIGGAVGATVQSAIATQAPKVATNGANGSFINFALEPNLVVEHTLITDEDNTEFGRPLMTTRVINTLSGYIKCASARFNASCYDSERDMINNFMVNGFFYE